MPVEHASLYVAKRIIILHYPQSQFGTTSLQSTSCSNTFFLQVFPGDHVLALPDKPQGVDGSSHIDHQPGKGHVPLGPEADAGHDGTLGLAVLLEGVREVVGEAVECAHKDQTPEDSLQGRLQVDGIECFIVQRSATLFL